ncbi:MAG: L,D-transpeptidase family protein [Chloroflexia bacterium]
MLSISAASSGATTRQGSGEAYIVIVKNEQRLYLAQGDPKSPATADVLKQFPVTTGALWTQKGLETPSGYFTIVSKSNSSVQGGYDFSDTGDVTLTPYFMRLDVPNRGGIGIHTYTGRTLDLWRFGATGGETTHGCIAGRPEDIVDLYTNYVVPGETKVWVVDDSSEAFKDKAAPAAPTVSQAGGRAWKSLPSPTKQQFYSVDMVRPDLGWAVSGDFTLIGGKYGWKSQIYKWDGRTWTLDAEVPYWLHGVRMLNENEGWAVGQNYMAGVHYVDGEWTKVDRSIPRVPYMSDVDVLSSDSAWMSGGGAEIFRWDGRTWEVDIEPDVTKTIRAVDLVDEDFGWMVGGGWDTENDAKATISQIAQYDGEGWFPVESPVQELFYGLHAVGRNDAWAVGSNGAIIHWDGSGGGRFPVRRKLGLARSR